MIRDLCKPALRRKTSRALWTGLLSALSMAVAAPSQAQVVINEVYGGGGNSGSTFRNDFIELRNNGITTVDIGGYSVQYASATGTFNTGNTFTIPAGSTIAPGGFFLIQAAAGTGTTQPLLPTPDATSTLALGSTAGKVALANDSTTVTFTNGPNSSFSANTLDFVGYGTTANAFEGDGRAPAPTNASSVTRANGLDTNQNDDDFSVSNPPTPQNSGGASPTPTPTVTPTPSASTQTKIVFVSDRDGSTDLFSANRDGSGVAKLQSGATDPALSRDGTRLAFVSGGRIFIARIGVTNGAVALSGLDGSNTPTLLSDGPNDASPSFSPDGTQLIFQRGTGTSTDLFLLNSDGNDNRVARPAFVRSGSDAFPRFVTNTQIVFARAGDLTPSTTFRSLVSFVLGSASSALVVEQSANSSSTAVDRLTVSPANNSVIYARPGAPSRGLYRKTLGSTSSPAIATSVPGDNFPSFAPDGATFAFSSTATSRAVSGSSDVFIANEDGSGITNITSNPANDFFPVIGDIPSDGVTPSPSPPPTPTETPSLVVNTMGDTTSNTDNLTTLREAITFANSSASGASPTISFNIPGPVPAGGFFTLSFTTAPQPIDKEGISIDGTTQTAFSGNTNTAGPEIYLDGTGVTNANSGLFIRANAFTVRGLAINNFGAGNTGTNQTNAAIAVTNNTASGAPATTSGLIEGNFLGTDPTGAQSGTGNFFGVRVQGGSASAPGVRGVIVQNNLIAFNRADGVRVEQSASTVSAPGNFASGISIRGNSIFSNGGLGINLAPSGEPASTVTTPDPQDPDSGPNGVQNFPFIFSARVNASGNTEVSGKLNSTPNTTFTIDLYANASADASGNGEGQTYLGTTTTTTNANGAAGFTFTTSAANGNLVGQFLSATATGTDGTSEFGNAFQVRPGLSISNATVQEPATGTASLVFTLTLQGASGPLTVTVIPVGRSDNGNPAALPDQDFEDDPITVNFGASQTTTTVSVPVLADNLTEVTESLRLTTAPNTGASALQFGIGTITERPTAPPVVASISGPTTSVTEGNSGTSNATFTVTLSQASGQTVLVRFASTVNNLSAGSTPATPSRDFRAVGGAVRFLPGETSKTVNVPVNGDTQREPDETFALELTTATNATISTTSRRAEAVIANDDGVPVASVTANVPRQAEGPSGRTRANFTVTLSNASSTSVTVNLRTFDETATAPSDYVASNGTVTFAPGQTSRLVSVIINGDSTVEPDETFLLAITGATGATVATDGSDVAQQTLANDD